MRSFPEPVIYPGWSVVIRTRFHRVYPDEVDGSFPDSYSDCNEECLPHFAPIFRAAEPIPQEIVEDYGDEPACKIRHSVLLPLDSCIVALRL